MNDANDHGWCSCHELRDGWDRGRADQGRKILRSNGTNQQLDGRSINHHMDRILEQMQVTIKNKDQENGEYLAKAS
eukprot:scaffold2195_cov333-Pavlova_lutheri.AAC.4